jgi:uncharacterized membrane-anchored protein YhcB (DUF1043 family)
MITLLCGNLENVRYATQWISLHVRLYLTVFSVQQKNPIQDAITRNAFNRFKKGLLEHFDEPAEALDDDELAELHDYREVLEFVRSTQEG